VFGLAPVDPGYNNSSFLNCENVIEGLETEALKDPEWCINIYL